MHLKSLLTVALAVALLSTVFAGSVAADTVEQNQWVDQSAVAVVDQSQDVEQTNVNQQSDNTAISVGTNDGGDRTSPRGPPLPPGTVGGGSGGPPIGGGQGT